VTKDERSVPGSTAQRNQGETLWYLGERFLFNAGEALRSGVWPPKGLEYSIRIYRVIDSKSYVWGRKGPARWCVGSSLVSNEFWSRRSTTNPPDAIRDYVKGPRALSGLDVVRMHAAYTENSWRQRGMSTVSNRKFNQDKSTLRH
jgi:hypothetical protein